MHAANEKPEKQIAYFSMEYGLHESIKIYSGGLGVLAGDFLKQASDDNVNIVAVGLLYRLGISVKTFLQVANSWLHMRHITFQRCRHSLFVTKMAHGKKSALPSQEEPFMHAYGKSMLEGSHYTCWIQTSTRMFLPTVLSRISCMAEIGKTGLNRNFYWESEAFACLDTLGLQPDVYHCNEGHAAFTGLERIQRVCAG
jgi:hypothetical protein